MRRSWIVGMVASALVLVSVEPSWGMYHASLGRWLSRDPVGYADGASLYEYAASAAVHHVDPLGTIVKVACCNEYLDRHSVTGYKWRANTYRVAPGKTIGYDKGNVRSEILAMMIKTKYTFNMEDQSLDSFKTHVEARARAVESARSKAYGFPGDSGDGGVPYQKANPKYWKVTKLNKLVVVGEKAFEAVKDVWKSPERYELHCWSGAVFPILHGTAQAVGQEVFDKGARPLRDVLVENWITDRPYDKLDIPGDQIQIDNTGRSAGAYGDAMNVLYLGNGQYAGHLGSRKQEHPWDYWWHYVRLMGGGNEPQVKRLVNYTRAGLDWSRHCRH